jgi:hypothetical protein
MTLAALKIKLEGLTTSYSDWFLPSKDELYLMYTNLHLFGVGEFTSDIYLSSSENSATHAKSIHFGIGTSPNVLKSSEYYVRACR